MLARLARLPWLSGAAIWTLTGASGALNAWGYLASFDGLLCLILVALALSAEVLGVRLAQSAERAWAAGLRAKAAVGALLLAGVVGFNLVSGHRALLLADAEADAPRRAAAAERARAERLLADIRAEIAALPPLPENVPAARLRAYEAARSAAMARLGPERAAAERALAALPQPLAAAPALDERLAWALAALIEALKALALWATGAAAAPAIAAPRARSAAADLANRRWAKARLAAAA